MRDREVDYIIFQGPQKRKLRHSARTSAHGKRALSHAFNFVLHAPELPK